jgi:type VI secretion system protein ImpK
MPDFDDPFKPSDATVMRPRPGAGRRGSPEPSPASPATVMRAPQQAAAGRAEPIPDSTLDILGTGLNPLVRAASPLLLLAGQLRGTLASPDVGSLRRHALAEIPRFEQRARGAGISAEVVTAARYALCACLDEAVLSTPWGAQSEWAQQTMLVALHREAWGGEKFFEMLDKISMDPERHIDLMELQYLCIALGFAGKYHAMPQGQSRLADVQQGLYRKIRDFRGTPRQELSLKWKGVEDRRNPLIRYVPWWVVGAAALVILTVTFIIYYTRLGTAAGPVHQTLAQLGLEGFSQPGPVAPISGPTIRQLLAQQERDGLVGIEEDGAVTRVTLLGENLFASGNATFNTAHAPVLTSIAAALDRVPGRVMVVGHTDNQAIRSLQYRDNFDLSRERAVSVATLLQKAMTKPGSIEWNGVGSTRPLVTPEVTPADRARNRRVEILHMRES